MADSASILTTPTDPGVALLPVAPAAVRWVCLIGLLGALGWCATLGLMFIRLGGPDFEYFYKAGRSLAVSGVFDPGHDVVQGAVVERGTLDWYLPAVHRLMSVLAQLPYRPAGYVWLAMNVAAAVATIWMLGRHVSSLPPQDWPVTQLLPFLLLYIYWLWELRLNQINALTLVLMVGSYVAWESGRRGQAGFWLGLAVLLKITPGLLVVWFLLKRQWRTVGIAVLTVVLGGPAGDLITFGPSRTREIYAQWVHRAVTTGSNAGLIQAQREMDWRNQALGAVVCRWLHPTSDATRFDNDPKVARDYVAASQETLNAISLPLPIVATTANCVAAVIVLGLLWLTRRRAARLSVMQRRAEWALVLLAMLCLMPVMRRYHVIWAMPALTVLGGMIHHRTLRCGWSKFALVCLVAATALQLAMIPTDKYWEAAGSVYLSVLLLAAPIVAMLNRLARQPDWIVLPSRQTYA